jgi:hypothetical protein
MPLNISMADKSFIASDPEAAEFGKRPPAEAGRDVDRQQRCPQLRATHSSADVLNKRQP